MPQPSERITKFNLLGGEDTYASQTAQNPQTARRLLSLIPSFAGYLEREKAHPQFTITPGDTPPDGSLGAIGWVYQADFADPATGINQRFFLMGTATAVYQLITGAPFFTPPQEGWLQVVQTVNYPQAVILNNRLFISDGVSSWTLIPVTASGQLVLTPNVIEGLPIPLHAPSISVQNVSAPTNLTTISRTNGVTTLLVSGAPQFYPTSMILLAGVSDTSFNSQFSAATVSGTVNQTITFLQPGTPDVAPISSSGTIQQGNFSVLSTKYYWKTWIDETGALSGYSRVHESSSSPRSVGTGVMTNQVVNFQSRPGTITNSFSTSVVGVGTDFDQNDVGMTLFSISNGGGVKVGVVLSVQDAQHLTLAAASAHAISALNYEIAPDRTTHVGIYSSESESSNIGYLVAAAPLYGVLPSGFPPLTGAIAPFTAFLFVDSSPFQGDLGSVFSGNTTQRPYRQDPPVASLISTAHKNRNFHRRETRKNFFLFSAYEEVLQFNTFASPYESYPGTSPVTTSDIINETAYPDQSREIRNIVSHGDALFLLSERNTYALYGESIDDFSLTQATAFSMGCAGRYASASTPHGLVFVSYEGKVMLYPTQFVFWAILGDATSALIELSRPKRIAFEQMDLSNSDNVRIVYYQYGRRNWLVLAFKTKGSGTFQTWVYDFETQGWFQLSQGVQSLAIFEPTDGYKILVGGAANGLVYVLDDVTQSYTSSSAQPPGLYRPALIDFGRPDMNHIIHYAEFEVSNAAMAVTPKFYLDPVDVDNPGTPRSFNVTKLRVGANKYRCFANDPQNGLLCNRVLIEFNVASDTNDGNIRSISLYAELAAAAVG